MITIEEVQAWASWANGKDTFKPHSVNKHSLAELAIAQHEEIERLRAELSDVRADQSECNSANEWQAREIERLKRERDEYAAVLAYYGNSCAIYTDPGVRLYAIETLEKYAALKSGEPE